jgi:hypothetical protein
MSSSRAKVTYGFNDMSSKISEVESALEDAAAICDAIENIAKVKDQAILLSLGIYNTTVENESDDSDGSETDSDAPDDDEGILCGVNGGSVAANQDEAEVMRLEQFGKNASAEETKTSTMDDDQLIDILRCCDLNWIEFVCVVTGMQENKELNLTENMLTEFTRKLPSLNLNDQEKDLIDQSRQVYLLQNWRKDKEDDVDNGLVVSESDGDDPTELCQVQDPLDAKGKAVILKKRAAIQRKAKREIAKRIAERRFFQRRQSKRIGRIEKECPDIGKTNRGLCSQTRSRH